MNATLDGVKEWLKQETPHYECEDCWYSCAILTCDERRSSDKCDCGADRENEMKRTLLAYLGETDA